VFATADFFTATGPFHFAIGTEASGFVSSGNNFGDLNKASAESLRDDTALEFCGAESLRSEEGSLLGGGDSNTLSDGFCGAVVLCGVAADSFLIGDSGTLKCGFWGVVGALSDTTPLSLFKDLGTLSDPDPPDIAIKFSIFEEVVLRTPRRDPVPPPELDPEPEPAAESRPPNSRLFGDTGSSTFGDTDSDNVFVRDGPRGLSKGSPLLESLAVVDDDEDDPGTSNVLVLEK